MLEQARPDGSTPAGTLLGKLLRRVARSPEAGSIGWLLPDLNGERERSATFHEATDHARDLLVKAHLDELVQHCGDTGAATGALLTAIVVELWRIGAVQAPNAVITTTGDAGHQGAMQAS